MSDKHTQGRLSFLANPIEPNKYVIAVNDQRWFMSILHNGEQWEPEQRENMRRLVACWNACEGMSTAGVEIVANLGGIENKLRVTSALVRQRDELLAALKAMLQVTAHLDACHATVEQARAAIAKAEGK